MLLGAFGPDKNGPLNISGPMFSERSTTEILMIRVSTRFYLFPCQCRFLLYGRDRASNARDMCFLHPEDSGRSAFVCGDAETVC